MVGVGARRVSVLARVSLVDGSGTVLLDCFVKVEERVTDYRTAVSGIRPQDLQTGLSYGECRARVKHMVRGKILVGHALSNDLTVLKLTHPWDCIRDTSLYPPFLKRNAYGVSQPRRLKDLTKEFVGATIQTGEHDSIEDARAAMALHSLVRTEWDQWIEASYYLYSAH
jgi:RNA exonuclease 4